MKTLALGALLFGLLVAAGYLSGRRRAGAPANDPEATAAAAPELSAPEPAKLRAPRPELVGPPGAASEARPARAGGSAPAAALFAPGPSVPPRSTPAAWTAGGVGRHPAFRALLSKPLDFMLRRTYLGKPATFASFASDRRRIDEYLGHPFINGALGSPAVLRNLLTPAVVSAFLRTPAMQDRAAVSALAGSPLVRELGRRPGVKALLEDPEFMRRLVTDPSLTSWLARHPEGSALVAGLSGR